MIQIQTEAPKEIILASGNEKKLQELSLILNDFDISLVPQSEYQVADAIEDGLTFIENAIKKARHACQETNKPAIADDSGIEVDYLNGSPGIYSARYAGENASDEENLNKLIQQLDGVDKSQRVARYQCVIVYMQHAQDPTPIVCQANWQGYLLNEKIGNNGFGYDPIFFCPEKNKTAAQMTVEEKKSVSHRGKALKDFQLAFNLLYNSNH